MGSAERQPTSAPAMVAPALAASPITRATGPMTTSVTARPPAPGTPVTAVAAIPAEMGTVPSMKTATSAPKTAAGAAATAIAVPPTTPRAATTLPLPAASARPMPTAAKRNGMVSASTRWSPKVAGAAKAADPSAVTANAQAAKIATTAPTTAGPAEAPAVAVRSRKLPAATTPQSRHAFATRIPSAAISPGTASAWTK